MTQPKKKTDKTNSRAEKQEKPSTLRNLSSFIKKHGYKVYPLLFALFPLMSFYSSNEAEIRSGDFSLITFIIFNLMVLAIIWPLSWLAVRSLKKGAILTVAVLAIFFSFGRIHGGIDGFVIHTPVIPLGPTKILLLFSVLALIAIWYGVRRLSPKNTDTVNLALSVVGAYLFLSTLISITAPLLSSKKADTSTDNKAQTASVAKVDKKNLPDIYYVLLDGYARQDILKSNFGYDNSTFINDLKKRGFYVADKSHSNYAHTHVSVPSTMNMEYVNYLSKEVGETSNDRTPLKKIFDYNKVVPAFKVLGYKYIQIGSQWDWANSSPLADVHIKTDEKANSKILNIKLDEFALVYLQTTAIKPWVASSIQGTLLSRVLGAFERTEKISKIKDPTLSFTHILAPHPPYLFNRNGPIPGLTTQLALNNPGFSNREGFVDQTVYTNKLALKLIGNILNNSDKPPIIIVASDHGPASSLSSKDFKQTDLSKMNVKGVRERMANLMTYYFPDHDYSKLYPTITPVNSFRVILKQYFNEDIGLLPDKSYFSDNGHNQYRFTDVTELVKD
jgi:hypothetical protein